MQRIRVQRRKVRRGRPWREVLAPDAQDPEVLRAKALGRAAPRQEVTRKGPCR